MWTSRRSISNRDFNHKIASGILVFVFVFWSDVNGAPPDTSVSGRMKDASRVQDLVTGDNERMADVVARAGATLFFRFRPRPQLNGSDPSLVYPLGYEINNESLVVSSGFAFTSVWEMEIGDWDSNGQGILRLSAFQDLMDGAGLQGANASPSNSGCDVVFNGTGWASCQKTCAGGTMDGNPCTADTQCPGGGICADPCPAILGESGPKCGTWSAGFCDSYWIDTTRSDWVFAGVPATDRTSGPLSPTLGGPGFAGNTTPGHEIVDGGITRYIGTVTFQVPDCCVGTYTIAHVQAETFAKDQGQPANNIPIADLVAGHITCQKGMCCTATQCIDNLSASECAAAGGTNSPPSFVKGQQCTNPPTTDGCCDCYFLSDCDDHDKCTVDTCDCTCSHTHKPGWNSSTQCCDPSTGAVAPKAGPASLCVRGCSLPGSEGIPQLVNEPLGTICDTGAQCIDNEQCDGAGHCVGTPTTAGTPCTLTNSPCMTNPTCDGQTHCVGQPLPEGTICATSSDPCQTNSTCDSQGNCVIGPQKLGPECLKSRYITFAPLNVGGPSALRVTLDSLQHPHPPNQPQFPPPNFSAFEGQIRWVGPVHDCEESESLHTSFKCAILQCTPFYMDWTAALNGDWLQITGAEVMPSSAYTIEQLYATCQGNDQSCTDIAAAAQVITARNGDCASPYQDPNSNIRVQPNITDVSRIIDKFKDVPGAISRTRAQMQPGVIALGQRVSIADVAVTLDAFKGLAYLQPGPQNCP